mgnify:CR=1 FL=1
MAQMPQIDTSEMDPRVAKVLEIIQRNILLVIGVIALIIALSITSSTLSNRKDTLADQRAQIASLESQVREKKSEADKVYAKTMLTATSVDIKRKKEDDEKFKELMTAALTWDSMPAYSKAREKVMERWEFSENSQFMSTFMPGEMSGAMRKDASGETHYVYDSNLRSEFDKVETFVLNVDEENDAYMYFAIVTSRHKSDDGEASTTGQSIVTYSVSGGEIYDVAAMPIIGGVQQSK